MITDMFVAEILTNELRAEQISTSTEFYHKTLLYKLFGKEVRLQDFWLSEESHFKIRLRLIDPDLTDNNWSKLKVEYQKMHKRLCDQWYYVTNIHPRRRARLQGKPLPVKTILKEHTAFLQSMQTCKTLDDIDDLGDMDESTARWMMSELDKTDFAL